MKVFCILSDERAYKSKSPAMHTAVIKRYGIAGVYVPFMVEANRIAEAVGGIRALNIAGANVTVPFKESVIPYLDGLSEEASRIGAVNTIVRSDSQLIGHNTDAAGFTDALKAIGFDPAGKSAIVFGTGGAAKAVAHALSCASPGTVKVAGRNLENAGRVSESLVFEPVTIDSLVGRPFSASLLVNTTSVSSVDEAPRLAALIQQLEISDCELVVDLNYGRSNNFWQDFARYRGTPFMDGLPMLAHQARRSFELWTGIAVDAGEFLRTLCDADAHSNV